ncbi:MAG: YaaR family protein [Oscillospiraceae bacterium]|jgi:uncharacterized protein YaaR (DUF327 family)|nr:YaaR family protein [Oscillospiraceae bacterium]
MKINDLTTLSNMVRSGAPIEHQRAVAAQMPTFRAAMQNVNRQNAEQSLKELSDRIAQQGEILGRRCDILELKRFKELVTQYLNEAVRYMYEFKKQSTFDARGRHRLYARIKKINEDLEKMTEDVLKGQTDNLQLLNAIDEVRGMLLDIFL